MYSILHLKRKAIVTNRRGPRWVRYTLATILIGMALGTSVLARATMTQLNVTESYDADQIASAYQPAGPDPYGYGPRAVVSSKDPGGSPNAETEFTNETSK